jgi:hypothetical protein
VPTTFAALTVDPNDLVNADPDYPVVVTVRTNTGGAIIDADANKLYLGTSSQKVSGTQTASFDLPLTNSDTNPTEFQYTTDIFYRETQPDGTSKRVTWNSGWFSFTAAANLADVAAEQYAPPTWQSTFTAAMETIRDESEQNLADQIDISGISTSDGVVEALVKSTGGAGPLTSAALSATYVSQSKRPVNLMEAAPSIDWTGATDSAAAVQAVLDAAAGARVDVGRGGRVRCDTGLTFGQFTHLLGTSQKAGGGPTAATFDFSNLGAAARALDASAGSVALEDLHVTGPGSHNTASKGVVADGTGGSAVTLTRVTTQRFGHGLHLTGQYYAVLTDVEAIYNRVGLTLSSCYDVNLYRPKFYCGGTDGVEGYGIVTGTVRGLNVFGGSIEDYGTLIGDVGAGIFVGSGSLVNVYGTYFEAPASANAVGIDLTEATDYILNAFGCEVYLGEHRAFIDAEGSTSAGTINAGGNKFECAASVAPATPTAYLLGTNAALYANIGVAQEDSWHGVTLAGTTYTTSQGTPRAGWSQRVPKNVAGGSGQGSVFDGGKRVFMPSSATGGASMRVPHGVAPTTPQDGDMWTTTAGLFVRVNGATVGPLT